MRGRELDDVPVEVLDDRDGGTTRTVELGRPPRRGRELVLVAIGIAVIVVVGVIGDSGGDDDRTAGAPTTTTTHRRTTTTQHRRASTTPRPSTTTTTWPQLIPGDGPLLPTPTGTVVAIVDGRGVLWRVDLDTGDACRTMPRDEGVWIPWPGPIDVDGELYVQSGPRMIAVDPSCNVREPELHIGDRWIAAVTGDTVWVGTNDWQQRLLEVSARTGEETGRAIDTAPGMGASVIAVGNDLVIGAAGDMTLVRGDGSRIDLGSGTPIGGAADRLLFVSCPALECALTMLELESGHRTRIDAVPAAYEPVQFSPDGRWARILVADDDGNQQQALVDLERNEVTGLEFEMHQAVFSGDGRWLVGHRGGGLLAIRLDDLGVELPLDIAISGIQGLAVLRPR